MQPTIRVFLADGHDIFLAGLLDRLRLHSPLEITGTALHSQDLLAKVAAAAPHVLVLDSRLPGADIKEIHRQLKALQPQLCLVVLYHHERPVFKEGVLALGVEGMLPRGTPAGELAGSLVKVHQGQTAYAAELTPIISRTLRQQPLSRLLTPREKDVYALLCLGKTSREIARILCLSEHTIDNHRKSIYAKCGVQSLPKLVIFSYESGLN